VTSIRGLGNVTPGFAVFVGTRGGGIDDDLSRTCRTLSQWILARLQRVRYEDDLQPGAAHLVLPRVRKSGTRTQGTAIPERIQTIVLDYCEAGEMYLPSVNPGWLAPGGKELSHPITRHGPGFHIDSNSRASAWISKISKEGFCKYRWGGS